MAQKKDTYYFSHDCNARRDPKIIALRSVYGSEGYGWWWILLEILREQEQYRIDITKKFVYSSLATEMGISRDKCQEFIDSCLNEFDLLQTDGQHLWSESMCRRMEGYEEKLKRLSERGKKGAAAKHGKVGENVAQAPETGGTSSTNGHLSHSTSTQKPGKLDKIRLKEINTRVSNDTLGAASAAPEPDPEEETDVAKAYQQLKKDKRSVVAFIREKQPAFIAPYVDAWNLFATEYNLAKVAAVTDSRKRKFRKRIREPQFDFLNILGRAKTSNFLITGLFFSFDWILENDSNYLKVLEGNYDNKNEKPKATHDTDEYRRRRQELEEKTRAIG